MGGRNPKAGPDTFPIEYSVGRADLTLLHLARQAREFAARSDTDDTRVVRHKAVLPAVHPNGPAAPLPPADALPECWVGARNIQFGILIVGNDGQDRANLLLHQDRFDMIPIAPTHRWTDIVKPE